MSQFLATHPTVEFRDPVQNQKSAIPPKITNNVKDSQFSSIVENVKSIFKGLVQSRNIEFKPYSEFDLLILANAHFSMGQYNGPVDGNIAINVQRIQYIESLRQKFQTQGKIDDQFINLAKYTVTHEIYHKITTEQGYSASIYNQYENLLQKNGAGFLDTLDLGNIAQFGPIKAYANFKTLYEFNEIFNDIGALVGLRHSNAYRFQS